MATGFAEPSVETELNAPAPAPRRPGLRVVPQRDDLVDAAFVLVLTAIALLGFRRIFGGTEWLVVGMIGAVCGVLVAHLCAATRQLAIMVVIAAAGVAALVSGLVFPDLATAGFLPSASSARELLEGGLRGWHDILSVVPPIGRTGNLLAVPFSGALAASIVSYSLARRSPRPGSAVLPVAALLVAAILVGTSDSETATGAEAFASWPVPHVLAQILGASLQNPDTAALVAQGVAAAVVGLLWGAVQQRRALMLSGGRLSRRPVATVLMLVLAATLTAAGLTQLTAIDPESRVVLRDRVPPPFDPTQFGSPLAGFRRFTNVDTRDDELFDVTGLPAGARIRLAAMDSYDGLVWNVAAAQGSQGRDTSGWFERVGSQVAPIGPGQQAKVTLTVKDLAGPWVPSVASLSTVQLVGTPDTTADGSSGLYVNRVSGTVALTSGFTTGKQVQETVSVPVVTTLDKVPADAQLAAVDLPDVRGVPTEIARFAQDYTSGQTTTIKRIEVIQTQLRKGFYSDGNPREAASESGHGARRIKDFLTPGPLNGNDEQYAATMALMLRSLDIPARVVVGFAPKAGQTIIKGSDARAWVEVPFDGIGYVAVDPTPSKDNRLSTQKPKDKPQPKTQNDPVPPQVPFSQPLSPRTSDDTSDQPPVKGRSIWLTVALWAAAGAGVLLLLSSPIWLIAAYKGRRRRRRRTRGSPDRRIAQGWRELIDLSADSGVRVPPAGTRREQAAVMPFEGAVQLAVAADAATFGPAQTPAERAAAYWEQLRYERAAALRAMTRRRRWRTTTSFASILRRH